MLTENEPEKSHAKNQLETRLKRTANAATKALSGFGA